MILSWKYIQGMGFHLAIAVFKCVTSTNRFSSFEKKVHYSVFKVKNATYLYFVTFSSHIVENPKNSITSLQNRPRRCFYVPKSISYFIQIKIKTLVKKKFKIFFPYHFSLLAPLRASFKSIVFVQKIIFFKKFKSMYKGLKTPI